MVKAETPQVQEVPGVTTGKGLDQGHLHGDVAGWLAMIETPPCSPISNWMNRPAQHATSLPPGPYPC